MPMPGKSVRIYLADGTPTGIRHAELVNWTGQAIVCPRTRLGELSAWEETARPDHQARALTVHRTSSSRSEIWPEMLHEILNPGAGSSSPQCDGCGGPKSRSPPNPRK